MLQEAGPAQCLPLSIRQGLPTGFVYSHGLHALCPSTSSSGVDFEDLAQPAATQEVAKSLAQRLRETANMLEGAAPVVMAVATEMAAEFMLARLPPPPGALPEQGPQPTLASHICCRAKVRLGPVCTESLR